MRDRKIIFSELFLTVASGGQIILLGLVCVIIYIKDSYNEDDLNVEKLGKSYTEYKKRVPRFNVLLGLIRLLRRK